MATRRYRKRSHKMRTRDKKTRKHRKHRRHMRGGGYVSVRQKVPRSYLVKIKLFSFK